MNPSVLENKHPLQPYLTKAVPALHPHRYKGIRLCMRMTESTSSLLILFNYLTYLIQRHLRFTVIGQQSIDLLLDVGQLGIAISLD